MVQTSVQTSTFEHLYLRDASERHRHAEVVLRVEDLRVHFQTERGPVRAVEGVTFSLRKGERLGLVGESGSGKSTTILAMLKMIKPPGRIVSGSVLLGDTDLLALDDEGIRRARFARISLIPQGAMNSLNPVLTIRDQLNDTIRFHNEGNGSNQFTRATLRAHISQLLESVGLEASVADYYPHQLSGGMKQRVCIAMGITLHPEVILADEPTSALDVVVQRQVMATLGQVQQELGASLILVGHDMGLMAQFVDTIGVMYAGKLVELGPVMDIFEEPLHPYTQALIASLPSLEGKGVFKGIPGITPSLLNPPPGCAFHPRCPVMVDRCRVDIPAFREIRPGHWAACHLR